MLQEELSWRVKPEQDGHCISWTAWKGHCDSKWIWNHNEGMGKTGRPSYNVRGSCSVKGWIGGAVKVGGVKWCLHTGKVAFWSRQWQSKAQQRHAKQNRKKRTQDSPLKVLKKILLEVEEKKCQTDKSQQGDVLLAFQTPNLQTLYPKGEENTGNWEKPQEKREILIKVEEC